MEKSILFTSDMEKAADEGRKTHTRRIIKIPKFEDIEIKQDDLHVKSKFLGITDIVFNKYLDIWQFNLNYEDSYGTHQEIKPPYQPGDHLWIKQNFKINLVNETLKTVFGDREDGSSFGNIKLTDREWEKFIKWKKPLQKKSKLFMFKSLAHKWIEVISVRAEQLRDITINDILKEGIDCDDLTFDLTKSYLSTIQYNRYVVRRWATLWDSINKDRGSWESNPYVWDYEFKRIEK